MKRHLARVGARPFLLSCAVAAAAWAAARPALAVEAYQAFLDELRVRNMHDMALEYLDQMRTSPLVSADLKQAIPYEEGQTLMDKARDERDGAAKSRELDRAQEKFEEFLKANSAHPLAATAEIQLGNVLVERGRNLLVQAARPSQASHKDQLVAEARDRFSQAQQVLTNAEAKFLERSKSFRPAHIDKQKEPQKWEAREQARSDLLLARSYTAAILYESSKAHPAGSEDAKKLLQAAADKYEKIYQEYRRRLAGLLARMNQGKCYHEMGDTKRALGYYAEILNQPDDLDPLRKLKASTLHLALQTLIGESEKKYAEAIARGKEWISKARPHEERLPDWLAVRYYTALALKLDAQSAKPEEEGQQARALAEARQHASFVRKYPGAYQEQAKKLIKQLAGLEGGEDKEPANFPEAYDRGKSSLDAWQARVESARLARAAGDEALAQNLDKEARDARDNTVRYFRLALELRGASAPIDDVNAVRYYLSFLAHQAGDYYDAAVLGEFLARKYPESAGARQGAKIAMAAYLAGYLAAPEAEKDFDRQRMVEIADYITRRWPNEEEADEAWTILMSVAANERDLEKAVEYLGKIAPESPRRGAAELKAGQALWSAYLAAARQEEDQRPPPEQLDKLIQQAQETLRNGIQRMRAAVDAGTSDVSHTLAAAALSLAQIQVGAGQADKAIELLNDPRIGPLTLVAAKSQVVEEDSFKIEAYKLALRAYVATQALDQAEQAMQELEALVAEAGDADADKLLTQIYIALGRELEEQVKRLRDQNNPQLEKVSGGFELFLERISGREKGNTFNSLNWVAATFSSLGGGYDTGGANLPPKAQGYFEKAHKTDQQILALANANKDWATPDQLLSVQLRMARTLRRLGEYKQAIDVLVDVLKTKPMLIDAQREAAQTYQDWGRVKDPYYRLAIGGARKVKNADGREEKIIWGWNRLAIVVERDKRFTDVFHEARYNLAKSRVDLAQQKTGTQKREVLKRAEDEILFTYRIKPDLGGAEWRKKYDSLLRNIQKLLDPNKTPAGLPKDRSPAMTAPAKTVKTPPKPTVE